MLRSDRPRRSARPTAGGQQLDHLASPIAGRVPTYIAGGVVGAGDGAHHGWLRSGYVSAMDAEMGPSDVLLAWSRKRRIGNVATDVATETSTATF